MRSVAERVVVGGVARARRPRGSARAARAPAASPPGGGSRDLLLEAERRATACGPSRARRAAPAARAGAPSTSRRGFAAARCGGTARRPCTACPPACAIAPRSSTAASPGCACSFTPARPAPRARASTRRRANGLTSRVKCSSPAPDLGAPARPARARARPLADHQPAAALAQRARRARARHSSRNCVRGPGARGGRAAAGRRGRRPGTTRSWRVQRGAQRRVVVHAQVAAEPDDRRQAPPASGSPALAPARAASQALALRR